MATAIELERPPIHMMVLRGAAYASAVLLFLGPLTDTVGLVAALAAVVLGLWLARAAAASRLRWPSIAGLALALFIVAVKTGDFLGGPAFGTRLLGYRAVLGVAESLSLSLAILALVFGFRALASRLPARWRFPRWRCSRRSSSRFSRAIATSTSASRGS